MTAYYLPQNAGDIARKYIKDPQLLSFIDAEVYLFFITLSTMNSNVQFRTNVYGFQCFIVSTVNALQTPMINASVVRLPSFCISVCINHFGVQFHAGGFRFCVTDIMEVLTTLWAELVELRRHWQKV